MLLCVSLMSALALQAGDWRIVPGSAPDPLPIPAEQVRSTYFRGLAARVAPLAELDQEPASSRLVIGLPSADAAIAALAARLGVTARGDSLLWEGRAVGPGAGLRLGVPDPDGGGRLVLVVAPDAAGLRAPFTVRLDLLAEGFTIAIEGRIVESGAAPLFRADEEDLARALAVRLDLAFEQLRAETATWPTAERARRMARAFAGYPEVLERVAGAPIGGEEFFAELLRLPAEESAAAQSRFGARSMQDLVDKLWARTGEVLGPPAGPAPEVYFLHAPPDWTNAATWDPIAPGGRPRILINLSALADPVALETALAHECVHARQAAGGDGLLERCASEGAAVFLSQALIPGLPDAAALMWSEQELAFAEERRGEILSLFRGDALGSGRARAGAWLQRDRAHPALAGSPSRLGYWVGWTAARAWRAAHPDAPPAALLALSADALITPILP